jgi:ribosome-associated translation inhibitor RaiA
MSEEESKLDLALMELGELNSTNILELKEFLKEWKPRTADEAIKAINFIHVIKSVSDNVKDACAKVLDRCKHCDGERTDATTGLKVLRTQKPEKKIYNETDELIELESQMVKLKAKIKEAKERAGYDTIREDGFNYRVKF